MNMTYAPPVRQRSKGPKVLFILGGIAVVVGGIMVAIGAALFGSGLFQTIEDAANARENLEIEVPVPGTREVYLEADTYDVVAIGDGLLRNQPTDDADGSSTTTTKTNFREPTVTVTTSEGTPVTLSSPRANAKISMSSYDLVSIESFRVDTPGTHTIAVNGEPGPVTSVGVGQTSNLDEAALARAVGGGLLFGLGVLLIVPGIFLLIGGAVWLAIDRGNRGNPPPMGPPSGYAMPGWAPAVAPPYVPPAGTRPVTTSTYPPSYDPPGPQTPAPPPLPPPLPPPPPREPPPAEPADWEPAPWKPAPWEPPQGPIS